MRMHGKAVSPVLVVSVVLLGLTACSDSAVTPTALDTGDAVPPRPSTLTVSTAQTATMAINDESPFFIGFPFSPTVKCFDLDGGSAVGPFDELEARASCEFAFLASTDGPLVDPNPTTVTLATTSSRSPRRAGPCRGRSSSGGCP